MYKRQGTGVLIAPTGSAKINTTVIGSGADGNVIGIRSFPGASAVSNVTISDTSTSNNAGGIHASGNSVVSIIRGAIGGNSSYGVGAVSPAAVRIGSSVVSGNTLGFSGPISSYGNNQLHGNTNPGSSTPLPPGGVP